MNLINKIHIDRILVLDDLFNYTDRYNNKDCIFILLNVIISLIIVFFNYTYTFGIFLFHIMKNFKCVYFLSIL